MWAERTFADALAWGASVHANREAVVHGESRITFAELARRADQFAAGLLELGVRPGDKFGIWLPDCVDWLVARWAVPSIGAVLVPINTRFRDVDLGYILKQSDCKGLLLTPRWRAVDYLAVLRGVVPDLDAQRPGHWSVDSLPELRLVVCTGDTIPPGMLAFTEVGERGAKWSGAAVALQQARSAVRSDDIAQILYTSGTTSFPKGAMVRHGALLQNNFNTIPRLNLGMTDRYLATSPLFSATGTSFTLAPFLAGGCEILMDGFSGEGFCRIVEAEQVTFSFFVEPMVHDIRAYAERGRHDLSSLRTGTGAPLTRASFRWLVEELGCRELTNTYGMSETSNAICRSFHDDPLEQRIESSGRPMPGVSLRIDSLEDGRPLNPGEVGEIRVKGYTVTAGYYRMPKETAEAIDADGWLHTGDIGELTQDGRLVFRGRVKEMIKPGGFNVATLEIEQFLKTFPGVKEAAVVGVSDQRLGEVGYAFVESDAGVQLDESVLIEFCRRHIASYKVPRYVEFVSAWPATPTGKIRKLDLKQRAETRVTGAPGTAPAR